MDTASSLLCLVLSFSSSTSATSKSTDDDALILVPGDDDRIDPTTEAMPVPRQVNGEGGLEARAGIKLEARLSVDTRFDRAGEHVAELGLGGRLELDVDLSRNV